MFAAGNQAQDSQVAYNKLGAALTDTALSFDTTTEAGASQQDAMEELAAVIDTDLADAYDAADGSAEDFANRASTIRSDVLAKLVNELGLTADEANAVADALGLADKDVEARFDLAGAEEARLKLGLLSGAMDGLPDDIERSVTLAIAAGDYTTALDEVTEYYEKNEPEIIAEVEADTSQFLDEVGIGKAAAEQNPAVLPVDADVREFEEETEDASADAEAEQTTMPVDADTGEAEGDIDAVQDADHPTTIAADGDTTRAAADLLAETAKFRVANINAQALTLTAKHELDNLTDRRTAQIDANANTAGAENELNHTARTRTSYVNQYVRTYGGYSGSSSSSRAAPAGLTATASSPSVVAPSITINTAVIGDRYDVQRVVARALRGSVRLAGSRS
jgi:hypothetical protein